MMKYAYLVHDLFNSESGVCGYIAYLCDKEGNIIQQSQFIFDHPSPASQMEWATQVINALWPNVLIRWDMCEFNNWC